MKKIISAPDYLLQLGLIQRLEGNPFFEKIADNVYYSEKEDLTFKYQHEEDNLDGNIVVYSDSEEKISKFEKIFLGIIGERTE